MVITIPKIVVYYRCYTKPYITYESDFTQVFHLSKEVNALEYSVGESKWKELNTQTIVFGGDHGKLLLRGKSKIGTNGATISFGTKSEVICTGDICTLVDYKHHDKATTSNAKFKHLFQNCKQLVVSPILSSKVLADSC